MRSSISILVPALALLPAALSAQPVQWEEIWDQPGAAIIYVDRASIAGPAALRSIDTRTVYRAPLPENYIAERIRTEEFDCVRHRSRLRRVTIIANDGRPPASMSFTPEDAVWADTDPESLGARKSDIACNGAR